MKKSRIILLVIIVLTLSQNKLMACSMYKITVDGKTMVGCNHDTWLATPKIWFANARQAHEYGAAYTGARQVGAGRTAPQSGMNVKGLAFTRLVAYHPTQSNPFTDDSGVRMERLKIGNEVDYLTDILHTCATVQDVRQYIERYDHSVFIEDVFIYIDSTGNYLIVEPYTLIEGNEPNYILANFCPSITAPAQARAQLRYRNGEDFLKRQPANASLAYCTALSDTMHVCRNRNGDGTLLTSIWDTEQGEVHLYFYHRYDTSLRFNLSEQLAKGDHGMDLAAMFPINSEFERLKSYKTPLNTPLLRIMLVALAGLLALCIFILGLAAIRGSSTAITRSKALLLSAFNLLLIGYLMVLATHMSIFYFDAPYRHYSSGWISASSYLPFLLLAAIVPFSAFTAKRLKTGRTNPWIKATLISNNVIYFIMIAGFGYWGLYSVWN